MVARALWYRNPFTTSISDQQKTVLNRQASSVEEFGKTIVFPNQMLTGSEQSMFSGPL
jgi:hypothetical protein